MTESVERVLAALEGCRLEQDCSLCVLGVHHERDVTWIQLHATGAVETDLLLRLCPDTTLGDALDSLRKTFRVKRKELSNRANQPI